MEKKVLIELTEDTKQNINNLYQHAISQKQVLAFLEKTLGKTYVAFDVQTMIFRFIRDQHIEQQNEQVTVLTTVTEGMPSYVLASRSKEGHRVYNNPSNTIYYDQEFDVAVAAVPQFNNPAYITSDYVLFATSIEQAKRYADHVQEETKKKQPNQITVFTDSSDGLKETTETITNVIERDNVVLEDWIKEDVFNSIDTFFNENENFYKKYNIPHKRGVLFYGEPGNGKTTLIKSIVSTIEYPVIYWQVNEFTRSDSVETVFKEANRLSPVVLVIEDIDSLPQSTRSTFLNVLDGATTKDGFFLIGTTNYPERLDSALKNRAGRFDRTYEIKLPNTELRMQYLEKRGMLDFVSKTLLEEVVHQTEGFSFVQLNEIFITVAFQAHNNEEINVEKVIAVIKENNVKNRKNVWIAQKNESKVGF